MHRLLKRQLRKYIPTDDVERFTKTYETFLSAIEDSYDEFESDQQMIEHTLETVSQEVSQRNMALKKTNHELERFAYVVSHDLQEPLRSVTGYTQLLERRYKDSLDPKALQYIEGAVQGAKRMQLLIQELLRYSRIGFGEVELEAVSLEKIVNDALKNLEQRVFDTKAEISTTGIELNIFANAGLLVQVFQNLISNGIKFCKNDIPKIEIDCHAIENGSGVRIGVKDNGIGIEPDNFKRIFEVFQRLHTAKEFEGTGIGLSVCQRIVERHGSQLGVSSVPGKGTEFFFELKVSGE